MTGQFEKLEINKELTAAEKLAIENLKDIDVKTLKAALNTESIKGTDKTFLEMATAYINHVIYTPGGVNGATGETEPGTFSFSAGADDRLKNFVSIDDNNDFAYLLYEISTVLKVDITTGLTSLKLGVETNTQLTALKKEIEKPAVVEVPTGATLEKVGKYTVSTADFTLGVALMDKTTSQITRDISYKNTKLTPTLEFNADGTLKTKIVNNDKTAYDVVLKDSIITLTESKTIVPTEVLTITEADIGTDFIKYGVKASEIVAAIATLQENLTTDKKITLPDGTTTVATAISYIKENKVVDLQKALGMEETATTLDKRADGLFGQRSLKNLEAGKIIEYVISGNATGGNKKDIPSSAKKINTIKGDPSTQHLVGPNYEGEYNPLPGYHFKNKEANDYTTIENVKPTYEEAIKNPTVYNLTYDVSTGELKPAKNYIWLNEGEDDFRAIPNQYDLKTRSINDLVDIAFSKKTLTEAEYKLLNKYDLMIIYSSNPKFKFNKEVTQDDKIIKTTVTPEVKNGSTNKIGEKVFDNYEDQVKEYVSTISGIQLQTAISENPYLYIAESTTWNTVEKINMNTYIKDGVLDMVSLKKTIDGIKTRIDNLNKTIETLRGKSYSATDIFGTDKKFQTDVYKTFFKKFKDNNVLIDESPTYTFYSITSGKAIYYSTLQFDLDQKGAWDDSYCKGLIIDVVNDKVINKDGTLNEDELKKFLAKKITAIIKDPENEYV